MQLCVIVRDPDDTNLSPRGIYYGRTVEVFNLEVTHVVVGNALMPITRKFNNSTGEMLFEVKPLTRITESLISEGWVRLGNLNFVVNNNIGKILLDHNRKDL